MELELKHLAPYLPYELKFQSEMDDYEGKIGTLPIWTIRGIEYLFGGYCATTLEDSDAYQISSIKLILRPLSDLTEEIEVNGEKFVPFIKLLKIATTQIWRFPIEIIEPPKILTEGDSCGIIAFNETERVSFTVDFNELQKDFELRIDGLLMMLDKLSLFQKLHEWHFDTAGLIEAGLAIDINSLKGAEV